MLKKILSMFQKKGNFGGPFSKVEVGFNGENLWVLWPGKEKLLLAWGDLIGVAVETTDEGPFTDDIFWHLGSNSGVLTYPGSAKGADQLLERLQQLPGFNNELLIGAMTYTENRTFILWDHQGRHE